MEEKKKKELTGNQKALLILGAIVLLPLMCGIGLGSSPEPEVIYKDKVVEKKVEVPVEVEKVVTKEKVVYKDSPKTLEKLEEYKATACLFSSVYPSMFEITKAYANDWGLDYMINQEMRDSEAVAKNFVNANCPGYTY